MTSEGSYVPFRMIALYSPFQIKTSKRRTFRLVGSGSRKPHLRSGSKKTSSWPSGTQLFWAFSFPLVLSAKVRSQISSFDVCFFKEFLLVDLVI